jgi:hypothetical protein
MFEPRKIDESRRLTAGQRAVVVIMNLLLLAELTWAMYLGQQDTGNLTAVFLRTFIPSAAVTLLASRFLLRRLQPAAGEPGEESP